MKYILYTHILNAVAYKVERCYISNSSKLRSVMNKITKSCQYLANNISTAKKNDITMNGGHKQNIEF